MTETVTWKGASGRGYKYWFALDVNCMKAEGGNYAFVKQLPNGNFLPLYFGETADLNDRLPGHEVWDQAKRLGATHIMAHTTPNGYAARAAEEKDLIEYWNPPLNTQHRTAL